MKITKILYLPPDTLYPLLYIFSSLYTVDNYTDIWVRIYQFLSDITIKCQLLTFWDVLSSNRIENEMISVIGLCGPQDCMSISLSLTHQMQFGRTLLICDHIKKEIKWTNLNILLRQEAFYLPKFLIQKLHAWKENREFGI